MWRRLTPAWDSVYDDSPTTVVKADVAPMQLDLSAEDFRWGLTGRLWTASSGTQIGARLTFRARDYGLFLPLVALSSVIQSFFLSLFRVSARGQALRTCDDYREDTGTL